MADAQVVSTAQILCTFGTTPAVLTSLPKGRPVQASGQVAATVQDFAPMANIPSFGMCMTPSNPQVAAATSAALGVLTPQPCIAVTTSPWMPGSTKVLVNGVPALTATSTCQCMWGGVISVVSPGQMTTMA